MNSKNVLRQLLVATILAAPSPAQQLSPLEKAPDWSRLDRFQQTIARSEFEHLLTTLFSPDGGWRDFITVHNDAAAIKKTTSPESIYLLRFAEQPSRPPPRYWRPVSALGPAPQDRPLAGLKIALDPGHLGGPWARMEERWLRIGDSRPVTEGDMTLRVARKLAPRLAALGAAVTFVRDSNSPVTTDTPVSLRSAALAELQRRGVSPITGTYTSPADPARSLSVQWQSELLFYRASEIRARARIVNDRLKPDMVLCLHFNAEPWGDPDAPALVEKNHLHLIVNGNYSAAELAFDDIRFGMLEKLLNRTGAEAIADADTIARAMAAATRLPPYEYPGTNAMRVGTSGYVWARNLLANRLYLCPVVYIEPYVMNSREVFDRLQAGDYEGERVFNGVPRKSIYNEYVDGVVAGVLKRVSGYRSAGVSK